MTDDLTTTWTELLAEHRYREVRGDYEVEPFYKHFGCSCGWEQNIAGMNGWRSWIAAHHAHVAAVLVASSALKAHTDEAVEAARAEVVAAVEAMYPPHNYELRYDGSEDPTAAAYVEGFREVHTALEQFRNRTTATEESR